MQTVEERLNAIEQALNTLPTALLNGLLAVTTAIDKQGSIDKAALKQELEELKFVQIENGNQAEYQKVLSLVQSRIS